MTAWSPARRIAFRFGAVFALLLIWPFPLGLVPYSEPLYRVLTAPIEWGVVAVSEYVLGIEPPQQVMTGSGDRLWDYVRLLVIAIYSVIATGVWSMFDRRRVTYGRLADALRVMLRYYVAIVMLGYGLAKVTVTQMPPLMLPRADQTIGEMSPMGMLWTFMGASKPYTIFTGLVEVLGSVLLLWRRTAVIGALVVAAAMTNVVVLNFTYDVPVKLFSTQLLVFALAIAAPDLRRLVAAALGRATAEVPPRVRGSLVSERVRLACKLAIVALYLGTAYRHVDFARRVAPTEPPALHGIWVAERFVVGGRELPPLVTDDTRWRKLIVSERGIVIRYMTDRRLYFRAAQVDAESQTIIIPIGIVRRTWTYQRSGDELVVRGELLESGTPFEATLRLEPAPELTTRGFHWIQEAPYHR